MFTKNEKAIKIGGQEIGENTTKRKLVHKNMVTENLCLPVVQVTFMQKLKGS
jgi:hypothetical protein